MDYKECKFYQDGVCIHEDAPDNDKSCLGYDGCGARDDNLTYIRKEYLTTNQEEVT